MSSASASTFLPAVLVGAGALALLAGWGVALAVLRRRRIRELEDALEARAREARLAESRSRALLEQTSDAVCLLDDELRIVEANRPALELLGSGDAPTIGRRLGELLEDGADGARSWRDLAGGGQVRDVPGRVVTGEGRSRDVRWTGRRLGDASAGGRGFQVVLHDVTELERALKRRQTLEEELRQAHKLESVGQLAGGIAHDFNNLLMAILGYAELLADRLAGDDAALAELQQVRRAGERAAELTRQLLTFSRRQHREPRPVDVNQLLEGLRGMLRRVIPESIAVEFEPGEGLGIVQADPGQLEQLVLDLCLNARDAMPDGGRLRIAARRVAPGEASSPDPAREFVRLEVEDTGIGMTPEIKRRVFEPFFTTKEVGAGTGLGLATVYAVVTQLGGHLHVRSEPGAGACFEVFLPASPAAAAVAGGRHPAGPPGSETVLVAEDEELVLDIATQILEGGGYRVLGARDGLQAVELYERHREEIGLVLLDAIMPGKSGRDVFEHIRAVDPRARILFCSGYGGDVLPREFLLREEPHLMRKPYDSATLLRKVREVLDA